MKRIKVYFHVLISMLKQSHVMSIICVAITCTGLFSLLYLYQSNVVTTLEDNQYVRARTISVDISKLESDDWQYFETHEDFENVLLEYFIASELPLEFGQTIRTYLKSERITDIVGTFSSESAKELIVPTDIYDELIDKKKLENDFILLEKPYKVIGYESWDDAYELPYITYKDNIRPHRVTVYLKLEALSRLNEIEQELLRRFKTGVKNDIEEMKVNRMEGAMILIMIASGLLFVNYLFLYIYLFIRRQKERFIYRLLGWTKLNLFFYLIFESTALYIVGMVLAGAVFWISQNTIHPLFYEYLPSVMITPFIINIALVSLMYGVTSIRERWAR